MVESSVDNKMKKWFIICGLLVLAAISASWMLSAESLDAHECFVSVTAREMLESGDWVFPTCNGQPRINKTPLCYWLVAGLAKLTGRVNEFTARLPSAVFAFLSAIVILYFVNRWLSFRIAVISTGVWITSLSYVCSSHSARPEMALAFFTTVCLMSFYSAVTINLSSVEDRKQGRRSQVIYMLVFWVSLGLGNLAKGPAPLVYVFIPVFLYVVIHRQWKVLAKLLPVVGPVIVLIIVLPWPLAIGHRMNWDIMVWKREFFDRLFGGYAQGRFPFYYYFGMMFKYITPWFAFLPMALAAPFYRVWEEKRPVMKFLWLWFAADLVFLTINGCKRQHYILPLMPAMAVLIGILLDDMVFVRRVYTWQFIKRTVAGYAVAVAAVAIGGTLYVAIARPQLLVATLALSIVGIGAALTVIVLFSKGKPAIASGAIFISIIVGIMIYDTGFSVVLDEEKGMRDFAGRAAEIVPPSDKLVAYDHVSSVFVQYFGRVVPEIEDKSLLYEQYERGDWIVCVFAYLKEFEQDSRFRLVYQSEPVKGKKGDIGGALFHKSAAVIKYEGNSDLKDKSIL